MKEYQYRAALRIIPGIYEHAAGKRNSNESTQPPPHRGLLQLLAAVVVLFSCDSLLCVPKLYQIPAMYDANSGDL